MSKSFYEVEFEGNYEAIAAFLKEKISCSTHPHSSNKLLIEINTDDKDELMFFNNSSMEDSISKIFKVSMLTIFILIQLDEFKAELDKNFNFGLLLETFKSIIIKTFK